MLLKKLMYSFLGTIISTDKVNRRQIDTNLKRPLLLKLAQLFGGFLFILCNNVPDGLFKEITQRPVSIDGQVFQFLDSVFIYTSREYFFFVPWIFYTLNFALIQD
jgi:hypothetical protein